MRTTGALEDLVDRLPVPLLSSNLALAHWLLKHCGPEQGHGSVLFKLLATSRLFFASDWKMLMALTPIKGLWKAFVRGASR